MATLCKKEESRMAVLGIVAEYDPLHNGHLYHLSEAKSLVKPDLTYQQRYQLCR